MSVAPSTTTLTVPAARAPDPSPRPLRLRLRRSSVDPLGADLVDGGWWPHSDDLVEELEPLLAALARRGRLVRRVSYSLAAWQGVPRKVVIAGTLVRLGGYRTQPASVLHLIAASGQPPLVLVVVPPDAAAGLAERALQLAGSSTGLDAAGVLAAAAGA